MKILYVITQLGIGGAESVLMTMIQEMMQLGHEVKVVSLLNICEQSFDDKKNIYILDFNNRPIYSLLKLKSIVKDFSPDVVHSHCLHANIVTRVLRLCGCKMKKLITSAHSPYEAKGMLMSIFKYTNFISDHITNVSTNAVKAFENNKYVKKNQMKVMYNIIDLEKYSYSGKIRKEYRGKFNISENDLVLISIGTMKDAKDYPNLLRAIKYLKDNINTGFKVYIVGDGVLFKEIKKLSCNLGINDKVVFLGLRKDIRELLCMSDIFILSSKFEGLPTVIIEATMTQNLIVTTDCGVEDIILDRKLVSEIENPIQLAQKIILAVDMIKNKNIEVKNVNYQFVKQRFRTDKIVSEWVKIYQS